MGGGRIAILLLLFALAIYEFYSVGFGGFAAICMLPAIVIIGILTFKSRMTLFWALIVVNFFLQMKSLPKPGGIPTSFYNEVLEIILLIQALFEIKESKHATTLNIMLWALLIWCSFVTLQLINDTCGMAWDFGAWYTGARLMAFQILYAFLVFIIYINTPGNLLKYLYLWGALSLFAVFWIWKQKYIGFTAAEKAFLQGSVTHVLRSGTLIRYFSTFNDAACAGIFLASTAVSFIIAGLTAKIKKYKYIFLFIGVACTWGMFPTGTRTAIACLLAGFVTYTILSKSIKMTIAIGTAGFIFFIILAFTNIGQGNQMIRRMRTVFDKNDTSAGARSANKEVIRKYMADAPFGIGVGIKTGDLASNHKYFIMSMIPPDSEYVYIWIHTGIVGLTIFLFTTFVMFLGASRIVLFKLTSSSLRGIGAGFICAFVSAQLGGYANQVLMQFPLCLTFYGGLSIVYALPYLEKEWIVHEEKLLAIQAEKKKQKEEKKLASRV